MADHPMQRLVVASSMRIYGEGFYRDAQHRVRMVGTRSRDRLAAGRWDWEDEHGNALEPLPAREHKTVALRVFNACGPRQALSNPYTGVLPIFAARLLNGRPR